jgi:hypothetical protein
MFVISSYDHKDNISTVWGVDLHHNDQLMYDECGQSDMS